MRISDWSSDVCSSDLVIIIPEGFFQGEWHVVYGASASQTISDNIDQDPDGERDVGFITRAGPNVSISGTSARVPAAFDGALDGVQQFGGDGEGFDPDPRHPGPPPPELIVELLL